MATLNAKINDKDIQTVTVSATPGINVGLIQRGEKGVSIKSIEQTKISTESSGTNEVTVMLDNGARSTFEVSNGKKGEKGDKGETGAEGKGIKSIVEYYQISTSNIIAPNTWETTVPALTNINKFLWKYIVISFTDNSTSSTMPAVIGVYGDTGEKGEKGDEGVKGDKGETGNKGENGISPIITTSKNGKVTTITITDAEGTHIATINDGKDGNGSGDMLTSVYDIDKDGIVDNAKKVNGHTIESNVPANAIFTDTTYSIATNSVDGLMSKNDKSKLDGLSNYNDTTIKNDISTLKTGKQDKLTAGTNITIANNTISAKDTTYSTATSSADGLMSKNDKSKLDNIFNSIYPVGSIYMSVNSTNPANLFGGTWKRIANGRTLIGVDENNSNFNSAKKTGGSFSHNHTNPSTGSHVLTLNEMPDRLMARIKLTNSTDQQNDNSYSSSDGWKNICLSDAVNSGNISQVGLGHNHTMGNTRTTTTIPQFFTCYIWQRTA